MNQSLSPVARSAWCLALINSCTPHIELQASEEQSDFQPWTKLRSKLSTFLSGELKSAANLERFFQEFLQWRENYEPADSLNGRITDLCLAATTAALDMLNDEECDDTGLIRQTMNDIYTELDELGGDAEGLQAYWQELDSEWCSALAGVKQRPLSRTVMQTIQATEVSPFGLEA